MGPVKTMRAGAKGTITMMLVVIAALVVVFVVHLLRTTRLTQTVAALPAQPTMHLRGSVCYGQDWKPGVSGIPITIGRVTVDAHPTGATIYWLPGLNSRRCRVDQTELTANQANTLASEVRDSGYHGGTYDCPMDDDSAAWVFFRYAGRSSLEVLKADLTGCQFDSAPHRGSIGPAWQVAATLQRFEPLQVRRSRVPAATAQGRSALR